jgi:hypothetical protein
MSAFNLWRFDPEAILACKCARWTTSLMSLADEVVRGSVSSFSQAVVSRLAPVGA